MKVSADQWQKNIQKESERILELLKAVTLDDSFGWGSSMDQFILQSGTEYYCPGVLFTGPAGCGKHTAANFLIRRLASEKKGCKFCFLYGDTLEEEFDSFSELENNLAELLNNRYEVFEANQRDDCGALCVVLEEPESYSHAKQLYRYLGQNLSEYFLSEYPLPLFFIIIIAEEQPSLNAQLRNNLMLCRLGYPDVEQRKRLLNAKGSFISSYLSTNWLAEKTEGFSFAELIDLNRHLAMEAERTGHLSSDVAIMILERLRQPPTAPSSAIPAQWMTQMQTLLSSQSQNASAASRVSQTDASLRSLDIDTSPTSLAKKREELETLPSRDLIIKACGEERAERMFAQNG